MVHRVKAVMRLALCILRISKRDARHDVPASPVRTEREGWISRSRRIRSRLRRRSSTEGVRSR